jgi:hypothetical protein
VQSFRQWVKLKACGYIGLAYETKEVKQAVSYDQGKHLLSRL